jgi:cytoskeleton protein RodZ
VTSALQGHAGEWDMNETDAISASPPTAGAQLRAAREDAKISLAEIASKTRIPQRHLEAIERDDFAALPSTTYSVGFARAFARAVGADEVTVAAAIRDQLAQGGRERHEYQAFEPADPARVPPRMLAWTAALIAVLIIAGYMIWRNAGQQAAAPTAPTIAAQTVSPPPQPKAGPTAALASASGPVVLTATDRVWVRISDAAGKRLFEKEMAAGETYNVPVDATAPTITTGRPNALRVTVGGAETPTLGEPEKRISGVGISAEALRNRAASPAPAVVTER